MNKTPDVSFVLLIILFVKRNMIEYHIEVAFCLLEKGVLLFQNLVHRF